MIIVQDLDKNIIGTYTTLTKAMDDNAGMAGGSYFYIIKKLLAAGYGVAVKYKHYLITRTEAERKGKLVYAPKVGFNDIEI